ncbi:MAG: hypothetical protein UR62_C0003G0009 [Candidatus Nomurabacteria bacterium GW2011_GWF2_35_12]|uniref:Terminase large subunit gp17-like C-terminal domain-containing protein n=3 Tax=Candidatus Nomuraibacteriota TaxID=1752729 RepID=A0A0G0DTN4_9BACT|nr:MAG: hypothetical protein UR62_C0003G0009 [Candidatus Nomurabacteria bacterium GW2011_GWF2_35_12]KKP71788.1 MAG: hypothetical protein UR70_C0019G0008 [Candidatus Nomurabacteria bacterium GW2011_GWB1_35_20]KKP76709.1 MAG: hypothetical protein UR72_C0001G0154 [Parcubacteria group bacterium GW2011_GWC1_35_21]KKP78402.1 MAG: hypothetical protein UR77_C0003G0009 [Candidatus Nomurabacteria bacterium GW2011_GWC2_35_35]KKP88422.1 MAG: hypothetical protein UR92_C0005G0009 [Candidatus Nomurabacteria b
MTISKEFIDKIRENPRLRQRLAFEHPFWFALLYLPHHFTDSIAPFHLEMFYLLQQNKYNFVAIMAFRESGKSTILNLVNALWSILGKPGKKFVVVISKTQEQAKNHFLNIRAELEKNELLREDFGPFTENDNDLKQLSLELEYHEAKIIAMTREQSIRGLKFGIHRPDLIIGDDLEDTSSVSEQKESEDFYARFESEIIPAGSTNTRIVILGNLLSENSFMMKLREDITKKKVPGIFRAYPLLDDDGKNLWTGKFPDSAISQMRSKLSEEAWAKEYLLSLEDENHYSELDIPENLKLSETDNDTILKWFHFKLAKLRNQYRKKLASSKPQISLIFQMKQYNISAPDFRLVEPEEGEPLYEKYQEYQKEQDELIEEFNEALRRAIHFRINPNFNYAEWKRASENIVWDETDDEEYGSQCNFSQKPKKPTDDEILEEVLKGCSREQIERIKKEGYYDPEKGIDIRPPSD